MKYLITIALLGFATTLSHAQNISAVPGKGQTQFGGVPGMQPELRRQPNAYAGRALALLAQREGLDPANLQVLNGVRSSYSLLQIQGFAFKILDVTTEQTYGIEIDGQGVELDPVSLDALELALEQQMYGKLEPELHELLSQLGPLDAVPVEIWLDDDFFFGLQRPLPSPQEDEGAIDQAAATQLAMRRGFVQQLQGPVLQFLGGQTGEEIIAHELVPVISAVLTKPKIKQVALLQGVTSIARGGFNLATMAVAAENIAATKVWSEGIDGSGIKVAVVEAAGGRVGTAAAFLPVTQNTTYSCWGGTHAREVASILASTNPTLLGIANGASLYAAGSCSGAWSELEQQTDASVSWGARSINHSHGSYQDAKPTSLDKFMDDLVQNSWVFMAVSAGNGGGYVETPGTAYNVMTVGNHDDQGTPEIGDDTINSGSDYKDPESKYDDRDKPEVTAPGTSITINATGSNPLTSTGTSMAAPMVTGAAALLMDKDADLKIWPEAVKAILMATAWNNVQGNAGEISSKDGAGGIRCKRAYNVVDGSKGGWDGMSYSCSASTNSDVETIYLSAGKRCRIVIVWDQHKGYSSYKKKPSADLDLYLRKSGSTVKSSTSYDNTFEMVDFTPSSSGNYTIRVTQHRCSKTPKYLAWAWHQE